MRTRKNVVGKKVALIGLNSLLLLVIGFFCFFQTDNSSDQTYNQVRNDNYRIYSLEMPDQLNFAGEDVPIGFFDVREHLDQELLVNTYWQSHTLLYIKRANRYFPVIDSILNAHNIPSDFKYVAVIESDLMNVVSPADAVGIWQFLEGTANDYGLEVNDEVDERYHLKKATVAACEFFKESYEKFGSWTLAAASFNAGRSKINKRMKQQQVDNYYDLKLNQETTRYIYRILAVKLILSNPENYGFHCRKEDRYAPKKGHKIKITESIDNLADFAQKHGTTYKMLKLFNPWLRSNELTVDEKSYSIKLPSSNFRSSAYQSE